MKRFTLLVATLALTASTLCADTWVVDKGHSDATFQVRHLLSKVSGRFTEFSGTINADPKKPQLSTVEFVIETSSINTDNADRDKHLRAADFFDVEKNPRITFKSSRVKPRGKNRYDVTGVLNMHGVSKTVTLPVTLQGFAKDPWGNQKAGFSTSTTLNRKDYGLNWNKALDNGGMLVGDTVDIAINIEAGMKK